MAGPRRGGRRRKKVCYFTANGITHIDYKDDDSNKWNFLKSSFLNVGKFFLDV